MERGKIKIPVKIIVVIVICQFSLFGLIILVGNREVANYEEATSVTNIQSVYLSGNENYGSLRGAVFYSKDKFINTSASLVGNNFMKHELWRSHGPIIDYDTIPHQYTLDDLAFPYRLSKEENCDTIHVIKGEYKLEFLIRLP